MTYPAIKASAMSETEARQNVGDVLVDKVLDQNCEPTSRVIDDCYSVIEMSASVDFVNSNGDEQTLTVLYMIDKSSFEDCDDLGDLSYDDRTFVID